MCSENLIKENKQYGLQLYYGQLAMVATNYIAGVALGIFNVDNANVCYFYFGFDDHQPVDSCSLYYRDDVFLRHLQRRIESLRK